MRFTHLYIPIPDSRILLIIVSGYERGNLGESDSYFVTRLRRRARLLRFSKTRLRFTSEDEQALDGLVKREKLMHAC